MNIDFVRGITAHFVAGLVVIGGLASIIWLTSTGVFPADAGLPAIAAIVAGAAGFIWGAETAKQASKQTERDILAQPQQPPGTTVTTTTPPTP